MLRVDSTDGAGHFVKMVHNGIEYADMQVIGERTIFCVLSPGWNQRSRHRFLRRGTKPSSIRT